MMFLCSVASELPNYDSCQSVHFCVLIQLSFCLVMSFGTIRGWFKQKWRGVRFERCLWESEVLQIHECFTEPLSMEGKYAMKLSITYLIKISRKLRKRYSGRLWKMQMWSDSKRQPPATVTVRPTPSLAPSPHYTRVLRQPLPAPPGVICHGDLQDPLILMDHAASPLPFSFN